MVLIDAALGIKLIYILGFTNVIGLILVLASCRCIPMNLSSIFKDLMKSKTYLKFYNYHCYYWLFFILSVVLHALVAIIAFGFPF